MYGLVHYIPDDRGSLEAQALHSLVSLALPSITWRIHAYWYGQG